jgi:hypothetical protein
MHHETRLFLALALAGALTACGSSGGGTPDAKPHPPDANTIIDAPIAAPDAAPSCDTIAQDCGTGKKCVPGAVDAMKHVHNVCITAGTATDQMACTPSATGDACAPGLVCLNSGAGGGLCYTICGTCDPSNTMMPCAVPATGKCMPEMGQPTYCVNVIVDGMMNELGQICAPSCDPFETTPCTYTDSAGAMQTNGNCFEYLGGPVCYSAGAIADGAACTHYDDCKQGSSCFTIGMAFKCYPNCNLMVTPTTCAAGTTCHNAMDPWEPNLGYCM